MGVGGQRHGPAAFPRERSGTHCIGGWVGPRAALYGWGKPRPSREGLKVKVFLQEAWTGPRGSSSLKAPDFLDVRYYKGGRSLAISTGRLYPRRSPWYSFQRLSRPEGTRFRWSHGKNPQRHHRESIPRPSE
jgi:hypothetical protein